jgi:hypothetical protein
VVVGGGVECVVVGGGGAAWVETAGDGAGLDGAEAAFAARRALCFALALWAVWWA